MWTLWLDGIRNPSPTLICNIARSSAEAKELVLRKGLPYKMYLGHDLGGEDTSMIFVKWLAENYIIDKSNRVPYWVVISANPIGRINLDGYLNCLNKYKN